MLFKYLPDLTFGKVLPSASRTSPQTKNLLPFFLINAMPSV